MPLISHSYPNLDKQDFDYIKECFEQEFVGFDINLEIEICNMFLDYVKMNYINTTTSASVSLNIILKYLNLSKNDEIIIQPINCWSVYNTVLQHNTKCILCDLKSKNSFLPSYETISERISSNTKVIILTHMYGNMIDSGIIQKIKTNFPNIKLIEDFSTSIFSKRNYKIGEYSDFAISSFGSTKPVTAGIGGLICSQIEIFNNNYDIKQDKLLALNTKLSRLNQSLLISQLKKYHDYQEKKQKVIDFYKNYINIYIENSDDLFRAITFDDISNLLDFLKYNKIEIDYRTSVQPNLSQELNANHLKNAFNFQQYSSLPLNIKIYQILKEKALI